MRWAAVEAVQRHPTTAKIAADKKRIEDRRGKSIAKIAAARKLLTLVYYGLRDEHIRALSRGRVCMSILDAARARTRICLTPAPAWSPA